MLTCHFSFSKSFSILLPLQTQHFASLERIGVPTKEEKYHFSFFLIKRHFCMYFYVPFHFFKLFFNFPFVAKAAFCKSRAHRGTPKGGKMSLLFFSDKTLYCMYFYVPFHFFKLFFNFPFVAKAAFCKSRAHGGTPKGGKISVPFFLNQLAFLHVC